MVVGLKFAGSGNKSAFECLVSRVLISSVFFYVNNYYKELLTAS